MSKNPTPSAALAAAQTARAAIQSALVPLRAQLDKLDAELRDVEHGMRVVSRAPLPPTEAARLMLELIDASAASYEQSVQWKSFPRALMDVSTGRMDDGKRAPVEPLCLEVFDRLRPGGAASIGFQAGHQIGDFMTAQGGYAANPIGRQCFFFGDLMKAKIKPHLDAWIATNKTHGHLNDEPGLDERRTQLEALQGKKTRLTEERDALKAQIDELTSTTL